jgi:hypothetical protein
MKSFVGITLAMFFLIGLTAAQAAPKKPGPEVATAARAEPNMEPGIKEMLELKVWTIYLNPMGQNNIGTGVDYLTFAQDKVSSRNLLTQGYPNSSYSAVLTPDGSVVWEALQANAGGQMAYWKAELKRDFLRGILSIQPPNSLIKDYFFSTLAPVQNTGKNEAQEKRGKKKFGLF